MSGSNKTKWLALKNRKRIIQDKELCMEAIKQDAYILHLIRNKSMVEKIKKKYITRIIKIDILIFCDF